MTRTSSQQHRPRRLRGPALAIALVVGIAGFVGCEPAPPESITLAGHGWGHGRGMSQFGAYGYAVDHGWTGGQILDRFYSNTTTSTVASSRQRVFLTAQEGKDLVVVNSLGQMTTSANGYATRFTALKVHRVDNAHFQLFTGTSCTGPWSAWSALRSDSAIRIRRPATNDDPRAMLQVCSPSGSVKYYRGDLLAVHANATIETVNDVEIEDLVRSVIAREISPSWADAGNGRGANAVRAQAVAARSYAVAGDSRFLPWATTCDSTLCQVYGGYGTRAAGSSTVVKVEDRRTDDATRATRLQIRRFSPGGSVARTEFSSSSGGFTAGGTFPVARDDGDDTAKNPNHTWTVTVPRQTIEAAFDTRQGHDVGTFEGIDRLQRNGHGDQGGRVTSLVVHFAREDVTVTGNQFRILLGLKSDWFAVQP